MKSLRYIFGVFCALTIVDRSSGEVVTATISNRVASASSSMSTPASGHQFQKIQVYPIRDFVTAFSIDSFNLRSFGNPAWIGNVTFAAYADENQTTLIKTQTFTNQIIGSNGLTMALTGFNSFTIGSDFWVRIDTNRDNFLSSGNLAGNDVRWIGLGNNYADRFIQSGNSSSGLEYASAPYNGQSDWATYALDITMTATVPEPGTMVMGIIASLSGGAGIWWKRRRRSIPSQGVEEKNLGD